jgi:hypothetical protein
MVSNRRFSAAITLARHRTQVHVHIGTIGNEAIAVDPEISVSGERFQGIVRDEASAMERMSNEALFSR